MMNNFDYLIGKKIVCSPILSDDKQTITFKTENSTIFLKAYGDCCSESWIEHFDHIPADAIIVNLIEKDVTGLQKEGYDEETNSFHYRLQQYFYEIVTDKGSFTIEMRNSSNGYYGGYLEVSERND